LALAGLLAGTALLYLWGLSASGWANAFYSAAVQAGSESWKAFFFGSSDAGNSITVDKTPASLWLMALSVRAFGLNSWSILVPQALCGVATVGVVFATVRRWYGDAAGLLAGAVLALTPVATLMFRFNNPDALLMLLLVGAAYATVRAVERASVRWLALAGALVGLGFLTKMLQALLVVPAFALAYLVAAPTGVARRVWHLLVAGGALVAAAGWWVAIVELMPASARPYIGGSQANSVLELTLGYNGLGRITGEQVGSVGGGGGPGPGPGGGRGGGGWGQTGLGRMFDAEIGGQVSWLLPAALLLLVAGLVTTARARRTDRTRAGFLLWGGWLLVTAATFSLMQGIFHAYYTVALAPAIGALVGMGTTVLWRRARPRTAAATPATAPAAADPTTVEEAEAAEPSVAPTAADVVAAHAGFAPVGRPARRGGASMARAAAALALAAAMAVTAMWAWVLLGRSPDWQPWLRPAVLAAGLAGAAGLLVAARLPRLGTGAVITLAAVAALAGPLSYSVATAATPHTGSIPSAGPAGAGRFGPAGGGPGGFAGRGPATGVAGFAPPGATGVTPPNTLPPDTSGGQQGSGQTRDRQGTRPRNPGGFGPDNGPGGMGGLLDARTPDPALVAALEADAEAYTWVAAAVGSNNAAGLQLATRLPVMPVGGFNGSDPSPTLAQFQRHVAEKKIHYFVGGGGFRANGGSDASGDIAAWVSATFTAQTIGGMTVYDLSGGAA